MNTDHQSKETDWNKDTNKHGTSTTTAQESTNMSKVWPLIMNH